MQLDAFDVRILAALQRRADMTQDELAEAAHLSRSQCSRRVQRLRETGYIDRVVALLDPQRLGLTFKTYVMVTLKSHADSHTEAFGELVAKSEEVLECSMLTGDADYLLLVYTADLKAFDGFLQKLLHSPAIATVRSSIALRDIKRTTELPLPRL